MSRTAYYKALILKLHSYGESNREALFLCREEGLLRATVYGGPKSKLRAYVTPYHTGTIWLYRDPIRDTRKVTDFDVKAWRPALRESYDKLMAASLVAQTIIASQGGGGAWTEALSLADDTLDALEEGNEVSISGTSLRFLWLWAELLGIVPDLYHCGRCACTVREDEVVWYSRIEGNFLCPACASPLIRQNSGELLTLGSGARRWLRRVIPMDSHEALRYGLDSEGIAQVRMLVTELLTGVLGRYLPTWNSIGPR